MCLWNKYLALIFMVSIIYSSGHFVNLRLLAPNFVKKNTNAELIEHQILRKCQIWRSYS